MQSTVYESKQNGEDFFSLPSVTYSRFGNWMANGLVTEQPQYSVVICVFSIWQNTETMLISNSLRFILTCLLFLAQPITFHCARHTFGTLALSKGMPIESVSRVLGHTNIVTTQIYAKITTQKLDNDLTMFGNKLNASFGSVTP